MTITNLTIVILTNRSDDRFEHALHSSQFAETVIVIDNTVNTDWKKLQKKYSFSVVAHPEKITDFARIRNSILKQIETKWVFFLDSDEVLPKSATTEIAGLIDADLFDAVSVVRKDYFLGKPLNYGEAGGMHLVRLFKVGSGKFIHPVHEVVEVNGKIGEANFSIAHYSHESIRAFLDKIAWYAGQVRTQKHLSKLELLMQMFLYPPAKFCLNYFIKLGFLDGYRGLVYALLMSLHSFYVRVYYFESQKL